MRSQRHAHKRRDVVIVSRTPRVGGGGSKPLILPIHYTPPPPHRTPSCRTVSCDILHIKLYVLAPSLSVHLLNSLPFFGPTEHRMSEYFLFIKPFLFPVQKYRFFRITESNAGFVIVILFLHQRFILTVRSFRAPGARSNQSNHL